MCQESIAAEQLPTALISQSLQSENMNSSVNYGIICCKGKTSCQGIVVGVPYLVWGVHKSLLDEVTLQVRLEGQARAARERGGGLLSRQNEQHMQKESEKWCNQESEMHSEQQNGQRARELFQELRLERQRGQIMKGFVSHVECPKGNKNPLRGSKHIF